MAPRTLGLGQGLILMDRVAGAGLSVAKEAPGFRAKRVRKSNWTIVEEKRAILA